MECWSLGLQSLALVSQDTLSSRFLSQGPDSHPAVHYAYPVSGACLQQWVGSVGRVHVEPMKAMETAYMVGKEALGNNGSNNSTRIVCLKLHPNML